MCYTVQVVVEAVVMEDTTIGAIHTMSRIAVDLVIITAGHRQMVVATVVASSMGVVEEGAGLVLDGAIIGETMFTLQKKSAGIAAIPIDGLYQVLV